MRIIDMIPFLKDKNSISVKVEGSEVRYYSSDLKGYYIKEISKKEDFDQWRALLKIQFEKLPSPVKKTLEHDHKDLRNGKLHVFGFFSEEDNTLCLAQGLLETTVEGLYVKSVDNYNLKTAINEKKIEEFLKSIEKYGSEVEHIGKENYTVLEITRFASKDNFSLTKDSVTLLIGFLRFIANRINPNNILVSITEKKKGTLYGAIFKDCISDKIPSTYLETYRLEKIELYCQAYPSDLNSLKIIKLINGFMHPKDKIEIKNTLQTIVCRNNICLINSKLYIENIGKIFMIKGPKNNAEYTRLELIDLSEKNYADIVPQLLPYIEKGKLFTLLGSLKRPHFLIIKHNLLSNLHTYIEQIIEYMKIQLNISLHSKDFSIIFLADEQSSKAIQKILGKKDILTLNHFTNQDSTEFFPLIIQSKSITSEHVRQAANDDEFQDTFNEYKRA